MNNDGQGAEKKEIGRRLYEARLKSGLTFTDVYAISKITPESLLAIEIGQVLPTDIQVVLFSNMYNIEMYYIFHGPLPYRSDDEFCKAYLDIKIDEETLCSGLHLDFAATRRFYQEWLVINGLTDEERGYV